MSDELFSTPNESKLVFKQGWWSSVFNLEGGSTELQMLQDLITYAQKYALEQEGDDER